MFRLASLLLLLFCAISAIAQRGNVTPPVPTVIHGRVVIAGRSAPTGVRVRLELGGALVADVTTDNSGKFEIRDVSHGLFECIASQPGYRTAQQVVDLRTSSSSYVIFELKPLSGSATPNVPPEGPGGVMSVKSANVPPAAIKEYEVGAQTLSAGKDLGGAIKSFKKAVEIAPNFAEAYTLMGMAYLGQKKFEDAEKTFVKATEIDPASAPAFMGLGEAQNSLGKFGNAQQTLSMAVTLAPDSAEAHYELAKSLWGLNRWSEAEPEGAKAIALNPGHADSHVLMGNILLRKRDAAGALREFRESLRLAPKGPMAEPTRQLVSKLESALKATSK